MSKNILNFRKNFEIAFGEFIDIIRATEYYFCSDFLNTPYRLVIVKDQSGAFELRLLKFDFDSEIFIPIGVISDNSLTVRKVENFIIMIIVVEEKAKLQQWFSSIELSVSTQVDRVVSEATNFNNELEIIKSANIYYSEMVALQFAPKQIKTDLVQITARQVRKLGVIPNFVYYIKEDNKYFFIGNFWVSSKNLAKKINNRLGV